jgi:hypothetical protein
VRSVDENLQVVASARRRIARRPQRCRRFRGVEPLELTDPAQPTTVVRANRGLDAVPHPPIEAFHHARSHHRELIRPFPEERTAGGH